MFTKIFLEIRYWRVSLRWIVRNRILARLTVELSQSDDLPGSCASQDLGFAE